MSQSTFLTVEDVASNLRVTRQTVAMARPITVNSFSVFMMLNIKIRGILKTRYFSKIIF